MHSLLLLRLKHIDSENACRYVNHLPMQHPKSIGLDLLDQIPPVDAFRKNRTRAITV